MPNIDRRYIEESFPVKEVSAISAKEKSIRHGHISTMHIWWARRPLASSRATNYAALIPAVSATDDPDQWQRVRDFIIGFSKWESSLDRRLIADEQLGQRLAVGFDLRRRGLHLHSRLA